nr:hypothetical protein [Mycoplasmopsis bovis]
MRLLSEMDRFHMAD